VYFENLSRKFKVSLKSDENWECRTWWPIYIYDHISPNFS